MAQIGPLKVTLRVGCGEQWALGPGKAELLEAIERCGSISAAGRAMGMSYRRAWDLVDTMNRCWTAPLVTSTPGGGVDRGARLTACGRDMLAAYRALETSILAASSQDASLQALLSHLLPAPDTPAS